MRVARATAGGATEPRTCLAENELLLIMEALEGGELFDRIVEVGSFSEPQVVPVLCSRGAPGGTVRTASTGGSR